MSNWSVPIYYLKEEALHRKKIKSLYTIKKSITNEVNSLTLNISLSFIDDFKSIILLLLYITLVFSNCYKKWSQKVIWLLSYLSL